jgi:hypothetical protein
MSAKWIGFLGYRGAQGLDLVEPLEAFMTAATKQDASATQRDCYETVVIRLSDRPFS